MENPSTFPFNSDNVNKDLSLELIEIINIENAMFKGVLKFLSGNRLKAFFIFRECWKTYKKYQSLIE